MARRKAAAQPRTLSSMGLEARVVELPDTVKPFVIWVGLNDTGNPAALSFNLNGLQKRGWKKSRCRRILVKP